MIRNERARCRWLVRCSVVLLVLATGPGVTTAPATADAPTARLGAAIDGLRGMTAVAPGLGGQIHRTLTRIERSARRFGATLLQTAIVWSGLILSAFVFLLVAALSSAADRRMFDLRQHGLDVLTRDLARGVRTFFRILRDRRTPYLARTILSLALLYWLLPMDLVYDGGPWSGFLDDLIVAVVAAKAFIHLCPDAIILAHASDVQARA